MAKQEQQQNVNPVDQVNAIMQNQALAQANASLYANSIAKPSGASYGLTGGAWAAQQAMAQATGSSNFTQNYVTSQQLLLSQQQKTNESKVKLIGQQRAQAMGGQAIMSGLANKVTKGVLDSRGLKTSLAADVASGAISQDMYESAFSGNQFDGQSLADLAVDNLDPTKAQGILDQTDKDIQSLIGSKHINEMSEAERQTVLEYYGNKK